MLIDRKIERLKNGEELWYNVKQHTNHNLKNDKLDVGEM